MDIFLLAWQLQVIKNMPWLRQPIHYDDPWLDIDYCE